MQNLLQYQSEDAHRQLYLSSRRIPHNDAAVFVENHISIGPPSHVFSGRVNAFVPLEEAKRRDQEVEDMWQEAKDEISTLFDLMSQVQAKFNGSKVPQRSTLRDCTWSEVMTAVQSAADAWKARPNRDSKTVSLIDKVGQNSTALEAWIHLLPAGDYGASICGVFKLAIGAAGKYEKIQESVLEALSEIPRLMNNATRYVKIYREMPDQFLERLTFQLFRAMLKTLRLVMEFFLENKRKKVLGSLMKQDSYGRELTESIEEVNNCVLRVEEEANHCQARQISTNGQILLRLHETSSEANHRMKLQSEEFREQIGLISEMGHSLHQGQGEVLQALYGLLRENTQLRRQLSDERGRGESLPSRRLRAGYDAANVYHGGVDDDDAESLEETNMSFLREKKKAREVAISQLWDVIQYDRAAVSRNISVTLRDGHQLSYRAKSRGAALVNDNKFREFMTAVSSMSLLVNGREDTAAADGISPLSLVVAEVVGTIGESRAQVFPLSYFCDMRQPIRLMRDDGRQPDYAPLAEMAASLVGQLLCRMQDRGLEPDVPSFVGESDWRALGKLKTMVLIKVLGGLVARLPPDSIVICAIAEVGEYETGALSAKLQNMMSVLTRMAGGGGEGNESSVIFKLLVTCRNRALEVGQFFGQTLDMAEEIEEDTSVEWMVSGVRP